jgi:hypothetical protein
MIDGSTINCWSSSMIHPFIPFLGRAWPQLYRLLGEPPIFSGWSKPAQEWGWTPRILWTSMYGEQYDQPCEWREIVCFRCDFWDMWSCRIATTWILYQLTDWIILETINKGLKSGLDLWLFVQVESIINLGACQNFVCIILRMNSNVNSNHLSDFGFSFCW